MDAPVSGYTVGKELGHGGASLVNRVYGHLGTCGIAATGRVSGGAAQAGDVSRQARDRMGRGVAAAQCALRRLSVMKRRMAAE